MKIMKKYKLWKSQQEKIEDILLGKQLLENLIDEYIEEIKKLKKQIFIFKQNDNTYYYLDKIKYLEKENDILKGK